MVQSNDRSEKGGPLAIERPKGRTLSEFEVDGRLPFAEQVLRDKCRDGDVAVLGDQLPETGSDQTRVRASFIRFLVLGGDDSTAIHEHGVRLKGAWIDGDLDLENCDASVELALQSCKLEGSVILRDAHLLSLDLSGSDVAGVSADRFRCAGTVFLRNNFCAAGDVRLTVAAIDRDLSCTGSSIHGELDLSGAEIKGSVYLRQGFTVNGPVRLSMANVSGDLVCDGGRFEGTNTTTGDDQVKRGWALICDQAKIGGSVFLSDNFNARGTVRFVLTRVVGNFECSGTIDAVTEDALQLDGAEIKGTVNLSGVTARGTVRLSTANVSGALICDGGRFEGTNTTAGDGRIKRGWALFCDQANIGGSLLLRGNFNASGTVRFVLTRVVGNFECSGTIDAVTDDALQLDGTEIKGTLYLNGITARGAVRLSTANVSGNLECNDGRFEGTNTATGDGQTKRGWALFCDQAKIGGSVFLRDNFNASGGVRFVTARIGGNFACSGTIDAVTEDALQLDGAEIKGTLYLSGVTARGAVRLSTANVSGNLECNDGRFEGTKTTTGDGQTKRGWALFCDQAKIGGSVLLRNKFTATGSVRFVTVRVGGNFECSGTIEGATEGALLCNGAVIDGDASLINKFTAKGVVSFTNARIGGNLNCAGGQFDARSSERTAFGRPALVGDQASIGGSLNLNSNFRAWGYVSFLGATIGSNLNCELGHFEAGEGGFALLIERSDVKGNFFFRRVGSVSGRMSLIGARVAGLSDDVDSWRGVNPLFLDGFRYERFERGAPTSANERIAWLEKQDKDDRGRNFKSQPWEQLIKVLREMGHQEEAKEIAIARQRWWRKAGMIRGWPGRSLHAIYGGLYGYGYRPGCFFFWMIAILAALTIIFSVAASEGVMAPTDRKILISADYKDCRLEKGNWTRCSRLGNNYSKFNPFVYSVGLIVPILNLSQVKEWAPQTVLPCTDAGIFDLCFNFAEPQYAEAKNTGYWLEGIVFAFVGWVATLFGWIAGALFAAVASGLVKKD